MESKRMRVVSFPSVAETQTSSPNKKATITAPISQNFVSSERAKYRAVAQEEHGSIINPITGEEVDIMSQCVNLQLAGNNREAGDVEAYAEVISDFAQQLRVGFHGQTVWVALENGEYQRGKINKVNTEVGSLVTYDFQYTKRVLEGGKQIHKVFIAKDISRLQVKTQQLLVK